MSDIYVILIHVFKENCCLHSYIRQTAEGNKLKTGMYMLKSTTKLYCKNQLHVISAHA